MCVLIFVKLEIFFKFKPSNHFADNDYIARLIKWTLQCFNARYGKTLKIEIQGLNKGLNSRRHNFNTSYFNIFYQKSTC